MVLNEEKKGYPSENFYDLSDGRGGRKPKPAFSGFATRMRALGFRICHKCQQVRLLAGSGELASHNTGCFSQSLSNEAARIFHIDIRERGEDFIADKMQILPDYPIHIVDSVFLVVGMMNESLPRYFQLYGCNDSDVRLL